MFNLFFRGQQFIEKHLTMDDVKCYWKKLLLEYSSLLNYKVKKLKNYNEIKPKEVKHVKTEL